MTDTPKHEQVIAALTEAKDAAPDHQGADTLESLRAEVDALKSQTAALIDATLWQLS